MANPNEYHDERYTRYSIEVNDAIGGMWESGATEAQIADTVRNALENCEPEPADLNEFRSELL